MQAGCEQGAGPETDRGVAVLGGEHSMTALAVTALAVSVWNVPQVNRLIGNRSVS